VLLLQKYATGDFSESIQIPEKEDEFAEILVGLSLMVDDIRELISTHTATADRAATATSEMIDAVTKVSRGDYSVQIELSGENDELDSLAMGLNMMIDDIRTSIEERVKAYQELQATQEASLNIMEDLDRQGKELIFLNKQLQQEITERKRAEEALSNANARLRVLQQVTAAVHSTLDSREVFQQVTDGVAYSLGYNTAIILTLNEEKKCFETKSFSTQKRFLPQIARLLGFSPEKLSIPAGLEFQASIRSVLEGRVVVAKSLTEIAYPIVSKKVCSALEKLGKAGNYILVPLRVGEEMVGALFITSPREGVAEDELVILQNFARAASQAIINANLHTQTKRIEEEARQTSRRLQVILDSIKDGIAIMDKDLTVEEVNRYRLEALGLSRDEVIGKKCYEVFQDRDYPCEKCPVQPVFDKGQIYRLDKSAVLKDGTVKYFDTQGTPIFDDEGNVFRVISSIRDVTERKQVEEALRQSEEKLRLMFEALPEGITIIDIDGKIVQSNKAVAHIYGYDNKEEIIGLSILEFIAEKDRARITEIMEKTLNEGSLGAIELTQLRKDRSEFPAEVNGDVIKDASGNPIGFITVTEDITERKRVEDEMRIKDAAIASSINAIDIEDLEGNIIYVNPACLKLWGYSDESEVLGKHVADIVPIKQKVIEIMEALHDKGNWVGEMTYENKDGSMFTLHTSVNLVRNESGQPICIMTSTVNLTERKQAEEKLIESEEKYRNFVERANDGICIIQDKLIRYANSRQVDMWGGTVEDMIDTPFTNYIDPDSLPVVAERYARRMKGEQVPSVYEATLRRKDGSKVFAELNVGVIDYLGKPAELVIVRDLTERKQAEEALRESEERYRTLVSLGAEVGEAIVMLQDNEQGEGMQTFINDQWARITGYSKEELLGMSFFDLVHPKDRQASMGRHQRKMRGEVIPGLFEMSIITKDGLEVTIELTSAYTTYQGERDNVCYIRDITERKQAEAERETLLKDLERINRRLEESNRELQDFVYIASHDLREPMRKITSFGTLLQDSLRGRLDEDQQENFEFMIDGSKRMQAMIDALLTYSRVTTKAKPFQQVNLNNVIEDLKNLELAALIDETKGTIHVPEKLPPVYGDSSQMHQLLQNLVANGLKFHREGVPPEITIRARKENSIVHVEVQDNGIGIGEEYREQVFTMFKRLHSRTQYQGTGIGLAACKKIVQRHGGEIGIKSTPDEGSIFWFTLPRGSYSGNN
jgi:PAS domain S-box-containing protein